MECYEAGYITSEEVELAGLEFGTADGLLELIGDIAHKRNWGEVLEGGVMSAAQRVGQGSERFAVHAKGLEFGGYEARGHMDRPYNTP